MKTTNDIKSVPGFTYTRAGSATAWRKDGTLAEFAPNVPRITDRGLLIEGQRTNLLPRWDPTVAQLPLRNGVVDATAPVLAPLPGRRWISLDAETQQTYAYQLTTIAANTAYSFQVLVETPDNDPPLMGYTTGDDFNMIVGSNGLLSSSYSYRRIAGNVWLVRVVGTSVANPTTYSGIVRYIGQKRPLKFSGFQLEQASDASSPIITTGAAATRGADALSRGGLATSLAAPFSVVMDASSVPVQTGLFPAYVTISAGSHQNWISVYRDNSGGVAMTVRSGGAQTGSGLAPTPGTAPVKVALAVSGTSVRWAVNGVLAPVVTATVAPVGMDRLHPLGTPSGAPGGAVGRSTLLFPYALTDAELVELTR